MIAGNVLYQRLFNLFCNMGCHERFSVKTPEDFSDSALSPINPLDVPPHNTLDLTDPLKNRDLLFHTEPTFHFEILP